MSATSQNILASQKAVIENLLAVQDTLFEGFEKLVDLNLKTTRSTLEGAMRKTQEAVELKDAQELLAFGSSLVRPDQAVAYSKDFYEICTSIQGCLSKLAESHIAESQKQVSEAVEQIARNAPTGSEGAVALLKSSMATATNAFETASKAAREAANVAEANFASATNATLKAAAEATKAAGKPAKQARATAN